MTEHRIHPPLTLGLTGGIGAGKSLVARQFQALGIAVINADTLARAAVARGEPALERIREHFGDAILLPDGELDRAQLRQRIFAEATERIWLESLLHPLVRERTRQWLSSAPGPYRVLESPLLLETDQYRLVDRIVVVDVDEATQIERASARDGSDESQIKRIIASQMPRAERLKRADWVIDNQGSPEHTHQQVLAVHQALCAQTQPV